MSFESADRGTAPDEYIDLEMGICRECGSLTEDPGNPLCESCTVGDPNEVA